MSHPQATDRPVVVTRAEAQDGPLCSQLRKLGLQVLLWPAIDVSLDDGSALERALARAHDFDWVVFASRHAVAAVVARLPQRPSGLKVAAVGQATARVLRQRGWNVDLVPDEANAAALVDGFALLDSIKGVRILYPASSRALPTISQGLSQLGAQVLQVEAYQTDAAALDLPQCREWIARGSIGAVTFASPSAVIELERALGRDDFDRLLAHAAVVAIGPTTARELVARGRPPVLAESATLAGVAATTFRLLSLRH